MSDYGLMIDEVSGALWKFPSTSIVLMPLSGLWPPVSLQWWRDHIDHAKKDTHTFLNAEVIRDLYMPLHPTGSSGYSPRFVLKLNRRAEDQGGSVMYTQTVSVRSNDKGDDQGQRFHWAFSYELHAEVFKKALEQQHQSLLQCGAPISPELSEQYQQRPGPQHIDGASMVCDFANEITPSEREFYTKVSCAPYVFRDCSYSLEQFWKSTRLHKDHHPSRLALKHRLGRETEIQRLRCVNVLLEKAQDPVVERLVFQNATNGMRILGELIDNTNGRIEESEAKRLRTCCDSSPVVRTSFFGKTGLPVELQHMILEQSVGDSLCLPSTRAAFRSFMSIWSTCRFFQECATRIGSALVADASRQLNDFVLHGSEMNPSRMARLGSWSYAELACSPELLLRCARDVPQNRPLCLHYFDVRKTSVLAANICRERAKRHCHDTVKEGGHRSDAHVKKGNARLERLRQIAMHPSVRGYVSDEARG
jgi:hypothetical protein